MDKINKFYFSECKINGDRCATILINKMIVLLKFRECCKIQLLYNYDSLPIVNYITVEDGNNLIKAAKEYKEFLWSQN